MTGGLLWQVEPAHRWLGRRLPGWLLARHLVRQDPDVVADEGRRDADTRKDEQHPGKPVEPSVGGEQHGRDATRPLPDGDQFAQAIFLPRVRGTVMGWWKEQNFPLL